MNPEFQAKLKDLDIEIGSDQYKTFREKYIEDSAAYIFNIANSIAGFNSLTSGWNVKPQ